MLEEKYKWKYLFFSFTCENWQQCWSSSNTERCACVGRCYKNAHYLEEYFSKAVDKKKKLSVFIWVTTTICYRTLHVIIIYFFIVFQAQKKNIIKPYSA